MAPSYERPMTQSAIFSSKEPSNEKCFPFLKLPAEIRNRIYELVGCADGKVYVRFGPQPQPTLRVSLVPSITFVSRQIRNEALAMFYCRNLFIFYSLSTFTSPAPWFEAIGDLQKHLRKVKILPGSDRECYVTLRKDRKAIHVIIDNDSRGPRTRTLQPQNEDLGERGADGQIVYDGRAVVQTAMLLSELQFSFYQMK